MTFIARTAAAIAAAFLTAQAVADVIPIRELELQGLATVTASATDIGSKDFLFDGDWDNIYRTPEINPAVITVEFVNAQTVGALRTYLAASPHEITLEAADTLADLDNQTGSYVKILDEVLGPQEPEIGWWEWNDTPVTGRVFRWTIYRTQRDDYVHIREIELQTAEPVQDVDLGGGNVVRINQINLEPADREYPRGDHVQFSATGSLSNGPNTYDVTDLVTWGSTNSAAAPITADGEVLARQVGESTITADLGVVHAETTIGVRDRRPVDLNAGFIRMTPVFDRFHMVFNGDQRIQSGYQTQQKWPSPGQQVTWTAHVFNKGDDPATNVPYEWRFDGQVVDAGVLATMAPGERIELTYSRPWPSDTVQTVNIDPGAHTFDPIQYERAVGDHTITLALDPQNTVTDSSALNNERTDYINAIKFYFYMEQHTYDRFSNTKNMLETYSPEDWAQLQLLALQRRLWNSGGKQRIRLDMLEVVPDGTLDPGGTHEPLGHVTWETDGVWGFDWPEDYLNLFVKRIDQALVHELGHQIGLIDVYQYDLATQNVLIRHDGQLVAGTPLMPLVSPWNVFYGNQQVFHHNGQAVVDTTHRGTMANPAAGFFGPGSVAGMNWTLGLRRGHFGIYLGALPHGDYTLRVVERDGTPVPNAAIRVFQRELNATVPNNPKYAGTTNASGEWVFPSQALPGWFGGLATPNPWSSVDGANVFNAPHPIGGNAPLIVELVFDPDGPGGDPEAVEYHFIEPDELNVAFIEHGQTDDALIEIQTYESSKNNTLPTIAFSTGQTVWIDEGTEFVVDVTADDAEGDPVTLAATPLPNSTFDPATGRFVFRPDSMQVTETPPDGLAYVVTFTADDGAFRTSKELHINVNDVDGFAVIYPFDTNPCPADLTGEGDINTNDFFAFLTLYQAQDSGADFSPPGGDGQINTNDFFAFLAAYQAGC